MPIYMIRAGEFGQDFAPKLWISVFAAALVLWDVLRQRRADYLYAFVFSTMTWTIVELVLQTTGMRLMPSRQLYGIALPLWFSTLLQGMAEGASVAILGLFIGDRLLSKRTRMMAALFYLIVSAGVIVLVLRSGTADDVSSRRNMVAIPALSFLAVLTAVSTVFWLRWNKYRRRAASMLLTMVLFVAAWTLAATVAGTRWIEVPDIAPGSWRHAPPLVTCMALAFDIIVEVGLAYLPFLALPAMLGWIGPEALNTEPD